jgi:hypothetical protein
MEILRGKFKKYELPKREEVSITNWQEYAIEVCQLFNLNGDYKKMIFRHAKNNLSYLKGRVENTKEKFGTENLETKSNYFISLFRKNPPWKK